MSVMVQFLYNQNALIIESFKKFEIITLKYRRQFLTAVSFEFKFSAKLVFQNLHWPISSQTSIPEQLFLVLHSAPHRIKALLCLGIVISKTTLIFSFGNTVPQNTNLFSSILDVTVAKIRVHKEIISSMTTRELSLFCADLVERP